MPQALRRHSFALLSSFPYCKTPHLVAAPFLLHHLNELCRFGHVMLQPLFVDAEQEDDIDKLDDLEFVDVPLPLILTDDDSSSTIQGKPKTSFFS